MQAKQKDQNPFRVRNEHSVILATLLDNFRLQRRSLTERGMARHHVVTICVCLQCINPSRAIAARTRTIHKHNPHGLCNKRRCSHAVAF